MIKLLIGGSPCTFWSIAQKNNRETKAEGMGWELFKNYLIAKEKFKPDFFLYENNKSADEAIKDQIKIEFGVTDEFQLNFFTEDTGVRYIEINSALVSAQNRERFYVHNCGYVEQPKDRGILLKDILESGVSDKEKSYCLKHQAGNIRDYFKKNHTQIAFEPVDMNNCPVQVGAMPRPNGELSKSQAFRIYSADAKSVTINSGGGGAGGKTGLYAVPVNPLQSGKSRCVTAGYSRHAVKEICESNASDNPSKQTWDSVAIPLRVTEATKQGYVDIEAGECVDLTQINSKTRRGRAYSAIVGL